MLMTDLTVRRFLDGEDWDASGLLPDELLEARLGELRRSDLERMQELHEARGDALSAHLDALWSLGERMEAEGVARAGDLADWQPLNRAAEAALRMKHLGYRKF